MLFFYPLDFTFVCPTEIIAFSDQVQRFRAMDCEVVACSCDSQFSHLAWVNTPREKGGLGFMDIPIVADFTKSIAKDYGVLVEDGADAGVSLRGLFIIDKSFTLRQITVNDLPVGRSVDETVRLVQAFQFTDVHGEVCPANWTPGAKTMKPDPEKSLEYFGSGATEATAASELGDVLEASNAADFDKMISGAGGRTVIVDFVASWCGKCRALFPHIVRLSTENTDKVFLKVDVTENTDIAERYGVETLPTIMAFKSGSQAGSYTGSKASEVEKFIASA